MLRSSLSYTFPIIWSLSRSASSHHDGRRAPLPTRRRRNINCSVLLHLRCLQFFNWRSDIRDVVLLSLSLYQKQDEVDEELDHLEDGTQRHPDEESQIASSVS